MKNIVTIILILSTFLLGCSGRKYTYIVYKDQQSFDMVKSDQFFQFDSTFKFYSRPLYKDITLRGKRIHQGKPNSSSTLIDLVFLLVSETHQKVVYVTYRPDKYMNMLENHPLNELNFFYLRSLQIGDISSDGKTYRFSNKPKRGKTDSDEWSIFKEPDGSLRVYNIDMIKNGYYHDSQNIDKAFSNAMRFEKCDQFSLSYQEPENEKEKEALFKSWQNLHLLTQNKLYLSKNNEQLMMSFEKEGEENVWLAYRKSRLLYHYLPSFHR